VRPLTLILFLGISSIRPLRYSWRITKDIYDKKHEEYQDQMQILEIELSEHRKADYDYQTTIATVISLARRAKTIFDESSDPARKRAFLNYLLQNPTVNGKKLEFSIASPFNLILELASRPNLLPAAGHTSNLAEHHQENNRRGYDDRVEWATDEILA